MNGGLLTPTLQRVRIHQALPYITGRLLDFGCGSGALADHVPVRNYLGVDIDVETLDEARRVRPGYEFRHVDDEWGGKFDTVAALAVLEHLPDPATALADLADRLAPEGRIVATTPHPSFEWVHTAAAKVGLASHEAHDEHQDLLGREQLREVGEKAGLVVVSYKRFLAGMNQLVVWRVTRPDGTSRI